MAPDTRKASRISEIVRVVNKARFRWVIMAMGHLSYFCVVGIASALTISIVAMIRDDETTALDDPTGINSTLSTVKPPHLHVKWTEKQKDRMLQAFFWGSLASSMPGGRLGELVGPRRSIALALFSAGFLFLLYPVVALRSFWGAYAIRVIQGISYGIVIPTMGCVIARWSPQNENTLSNIIAGSGLFSANAIVHPLAGLLVSGDFLGGWPAVFYVFGGLTLLLTIPWYFLVYDEPESHPRLSFLELEEILKTRSLKSGVSNKLPWFKMFISLPVLAYGLMLVNHSWLLTLVSTQMSSYYEQILGMSFETNGFMTALPWILSLVMGISVSALADCISRRKIVSLTVIRKGFTFLALGGAGIVIFLATLVGMNKNAVVALVTLANGISTLASAGSTANHLDISPTFAGTLSGFGTMCGSLGALAMNEAVAQIVGNEPTQEKWYLFFYLTSTVNLSGAILFCLFGSAKVQKWDPSFQAKEPTTTKGKENPGYEPTP